MNDDDIAAAVRRGDALSAVLTPADLLAWSRRVEQSLRRLAITAEKQTGLSGGAVGYLYGVSRNVPIGLWHRDKKRKFKTPAIGGEVRPNSDIPRTPRSLPTLKASFGNVGDKSPEFKGTKPATVSVGKGSVTEPAPLFGPEDLVEEAGAAGAFSCEGVELASLREGCCKFPLGGVLARPPYRYCGGPAVERSYCLEHFVRSVDPRFREAALIRIRVPRGERAAILTRAAERRVA